MAVPAREVEEPRFPASGFDALPPPAIARRAEDVGVVKAALPFATLFVLAILAGAFIAMGAIFATTVTAGGSELAFGVQRLLGGLAFSLGLVLVVLAGAELFTGNNLVAIAWASRRVSTARLLVTWGIVYAGNFAGAVATAALMYLSGQYRFGGGAVGEQAVAIATAKVQLGFVEAIVLGMFCNALVCLAIWLSYSGRTTTDKILAVVGPIAAFVAVGFEHCVANMYFIPFGILVKGDEEWAAAATLPAGATDLTWSSFLVDNLVPVTIGNLIGGTLMVGAVYWWVYRRPSSD